MPTITPNLGMTLPDLHEQGWGPPILNEDFTLIDNFAATVVVSNPAASQEITQPAGTYLSINSLQAYGAAPVIRFGVNPNNWDASITRTSAGVISFDSNAVGNGAATATAGIFNAQTGFQVAGAAPVGYLLVGNGTSYVASSTLPPGVGHYQTIEAAGAVKTQRTYLNFLAPIAVTDNPGNNSTDISLAASGAAAGTYANPTMTVDVAGRVTAIAGGSGVVATQSIVTGSRALGTQYHNASASPIVVVVTLTCPGNASGTASVMCGPTSGALPSIASQSTVSFSSGTTNDCLTFIVPAGYYYKVSVDVSLYLYIWTETTLS